MNTNDDKNTLGVITNKDDDFDEYYYYYYYAYYVEYITTYIPPLNLNPRGSVPCLFKCTILSPVLQSKMK